MRFSESTDATERARAVAVLALTGYDVSPRRLVRQSESFNTVFRVSCDETSYLLRVGPQRRIHEVGAAGAEAAWTQLLAARGLPVPTVVPARDGAPSVMVELPDTPGTHECMLLTWRAGRRVIRPLRARDLRELAVLSASLHEVSAPCRTRPTGVLDGRRALHFELPDLLPDAPQPHRAVLTSALEVAQQAIDHLWDAATQPPRVVHSDLTPNNVLRTRDGLAAIDFQDLTWAHVEQDVANTLFGITRGVGTDDVLPAFRGAYEKVRPWPERLDALLPHLVAARRLEMVNLALAMQRPDLDGYLTRHCVALREYLATAD